MPAPHLPSGAVLQEFWGRLRAEAKEQERPVMVLAGGMAISAVSRVPANLLWLGTASVWGVHKASELLAGALLSHYFDLLRDIRAEGFGAWWAEEFRPYLLAAAAQFSLAHESSTEKFLR